MVLILGFGDSLMYGAWDTEGGFIERLRKFLESKSKDNFVYNLGIPIDETSRKLISRIKSEAEVRVTPDFEEENVVLFSIGTNDTQFIRSKGSIRIDEMEFENNIRKLISIARKFSSRIVFVGLIGVDESRVDPIPWDTDKSYKNDYIRKYDGLLEKICSEEKVGYIKLFGKIPKELLEDGVHPNSEGHQKIFEAIRDFLIKNKIIH
jgi:lysophospholipase L1-like esterase